MSIVLFDVDGVIVRADGTIRPGVVMTIRTLMALDYDIHLWSAAGEQHARRVADRIGLGLPFIATHTKPPEPMAEFEALRIVGEKPALQIDDDRKQRIADWPFLVWTQR